MDQHAPLLLCVGLALLLLCGCGEGNDKFNQNDNLVPVSATPLKKSYYLVYQAPEGSGKDVQCYLSPSVRGAGPLVDCEEAIVLAQLLHRQIFDRNELPSVRESDSYALCGVPACRNDALLTEYCSYYLDRQSTLEKGGSVTAMARTFPTDTLAAAADCALGLYR